VLFTTCIASTQLLAEAASYKHASLFALKLLMYVDVAAATGSAANAPEVVNGL
jgi:hypothetical protein